MCLPDEQVVVFRVGHEEYGMTIAQVSEVVPYSTPTPLPGSPPLVEGVVNLRGQVIPVVDLAGRFHTQRLKVGADSRIMVVDLHGRVAGLVVDEVLEVLRVGAADVEPPSPLWSENDRVVRGVARLAERLIILVNPEEIVSQVLGARS